MVVGSEMPRWLEPNGRRGINEDMVRTPEGVGWGRRVSSRERPTPSSYEVMMSGVASNPGFPSSFWWGV